MRRPFVLPFAPHIAQVGHHLTGEQFSILAHEFGRHGTHVNTGYEVTAIETLHCFAQAFPHCAGRARDYDAVVNQIFPRLVLFQLNG